MATEGSTKYTSVVIATEATFASVDPMTGIPDPGGLIFDGVSGLARLPEITLGELATTSNDDRARCGAYATAPEPQAVWLGGARVRVRRGDLVLTFEDVSLVGAGTGGIFSYDNLPLAMCMASSLGDDGTFITDDTVAGAVDANAFISTMNASDYSTGGIISAEIDGRMEYSAIAGNSGAGAGTINISPAMSVSLSNEAIRLARTLYPKTDGPSGGSLCFRLDGIGVRSYAYGCRHKSSVWTAVGGRLQVAVTMGVAGFIDDHANAALECPVVQCGAAQHVTGAFVVIGSAANPVGCSGTMAPYAIGREAVAFEADSVTWTIDTPLAPVGGAEADAIGFSEWAVVDTTLTVGMKLRTPTTTLDDDMLNGVYRSLMIGTSPGGQGQGLALYVPSAFLTVDGSKRDSSGDTVQMSATWGAGSWDGDKTDAAGIKAAANTAFRLGLGL